MRVALVAIVKQESNLPEWIAWHRAWGFDEVYLIANDWKVPEGLDAIYLEAPGKAVQLAAYNAWLTIYGRDFDYVAFFDADEYLYLTNRKSVKDLLVGHSLGINWVFFGSTEDEDGPATGVVGRFKYRQQFTDKHIKSIVRLAGNVLMLDPHHANVGTYSPEGETIKGPFNKVGTMHNAFIAHYYTQDFEYFKKKCDRGRADTGDKFNHSYSEWVEYNKICNLVYDTRLAEKFKQLKNG